MGTFESKFRTALAEVEAVYDQFPWDDQTAYTDWLAQTYFFVANSTRLLCSAAARFAKSEESFHLRFLDHMKEERSHDVLALRDLKALGYGIEKFEEYPETSAFYQSQYHLIEHHHPVALLGYILCLEGISVTRGRKAYEKSKAAFGQDATSFWKVHAEEDPDHLTKAFRQVDALNHEKQYLVLKSLQQSCVIYCHMLRKIQMKATGSSSIKASA